MVVRVRQAQAREVRRTVWVRRELIRFPVDRARDRVHVGRRVDQQERAPVPAQRDCGTVDGIRVDRRVESRRVGRIGARGVGKAQQVEQVDLLQRVDAGEGGGIADEIGAPR